MVYVVKLNVAWTIVLHLLLQMFPVSTKVILSPLVRVFRTQTMKLLPVPRVSTAPARPTP